MKYLLFIALLLLSISSFAMNAEEAKILSHKAHIANVKAELKNINKYINNSIKEAVELGEFSAVVEVSPRLNESDVQLTIDNLRKNGFNVEFIRSPYGANYINISWGK